jgi:hypothetical protein
MTIAIPVTTANRIFVGALVANVTHRAVLTTLLVFAPGDSGDLYVIGPDGSEIFSLHADARPLRRSCFSRTNAAPSPMQIVTEKRSSELSSGFPAWSGRSWRRSRRRRRARRLPSSVT